MSKHPILLLHGWGLSKGKYHKLKKLFREDNYQIYAIDLPGFGESQIPLKPYYLNDYVDFVINFLNKNKIQKPVIIGHSFGGRIAIKLAFLYPDLADKLILTGVPGITEHSLKILIFKIIAKTGKVIFNLPIITALSPCARKMLYRFAKTTDYLKAKGIMRQTLKNIIYEDLQKPMQKLKVPVFLVWGTMDTMTPVKIARKMQQLIPHSYLDIIPKYGHKLPYKNAKIFYRLIKKKIL